MDAKQEFAHVSKLIKTEVARFEQERIEDFKDSLHAFLEGMIARQKEVSFACFSLGYWLTLETITADWGLGELPAETTEEGRHRKGYYAGYRHSRDSSFTVFLSLC